MKYPQHYISSRDIDWFAIINGKYIHVASAGGNLPKKINDRNKLKEIQTAVQRMPFIYERDEIVVNEDFLKEEKHLENLEEYIESFVNMARKGFISFDRTNLLDIDESMYHVVCYPRDINSQEIYIDSAMESINIDSKLLDLKRKIDIVEIIDEYYSNFQ